MAEITATGIGIPIFRGLAVGGYALYPGSGEGIRLDFLPGLTLVLGANGLGKTTLVLMLYRLLSGPFDISGLDDDGTVGSGRIDAVGIPAGIRAQFARRVSDGARDANAELHFSVGAVGFVVRRRLADLSLQELHVGGHEAGRREVEDYQANIIDAAGLSSFGDWILLLRRLVFYFEERRALVWDPSAQRQLLRLLFLPARTAGEWTSLEREILQLDSHMRNLQAALSREERDITRTQARIEGSGAVREELEALGPLQDDDRQLHERMEEEVLALDTRRREARLRVMEAEQRREVQLRDLERVKLLAIGSFFPRASETGRFILSQLMASDECLVCGHAVPSVAAMLSRRIGAGKCVVCGSRLSEGNVEGVDAHLVTRALQRLNDATTEFENSTRLSEQASADYTVQAQSLAQVGARMADRAQRIEALVAALPPEEADVHRQRSEIGLLRTRVSQLREQVDSKRTAFAAFVERASRAVVERATEIQHAFEELARGFLVEQCDLVWAPHLARVGQTGQTIAFPSFELSLSGSDFAGPTRRAGPEDVSESQREFIDLSFRMALMTVASTTGSGSLVVDAPESSVDGVFAPRAADVLARFARTAEQNRLIITSNLVDGSLLPRLIQSAIPVDEQDQRIVDLLRLARPTAAVRDYADMYRAFRDRLLSRDQA